MTLPVVYHWESVAVVSPAVEQIASLLDQCSPDELSVILQAIEGGSLPEDAEQLAADPPTVALMSSHVLPPAGPPPAATGRRPVHAGVKRSAADEEQLATLGEVKQFLDDHSVDLELLAKVLTARDDEVKELERELAAIKDTLASKERHVATLGGELDLATREVRHRQLDLEFQQAKIDEGARSNAELEAAQRSLVARADGASLRARHASLDIDYGKTMMPGSIVHAQGSLAWSMRKKPALGFA